MLINKEGILIQKEKLQTLYANFGEFLSYDWYYRITESLGFSNTLECWLANPEVELDASEELLTIKGYKPEN